MPETLLQQLLPVCREAGEAILQVYNSAFQVDRKSDDSPVTMADMAAHRLLVPALQQLEAIPVLSEEAEIPDFQQRRHWRRYWLIDPLDGTREFIQRNPDFTVNVALIENHQPILGIVHAPVSGTTYGGIPGVGAWKFEQGVHTVIHARDAADRLELVVSRHHGGRAAEPLIKTLSNHYGQINLQYVGSSLKLCLVAEGKADLYPRLAPTCEWDTAAAQAVVEAAGGRVVNSQMAPLQYNIKASLLNPHFFVLGKGDFDWASLLSSY